TNNIRQIARLTTVVALSKLFLESIGPPLVLTASYSARNQLCIGNPKLETLNPKPLLRLDSLECEVAPTLTQLECADLVSFDGEGDRRLNFVNREFRFADRYRRKPITTVVDLAEELPVLDFNRQLSDLIVLIFSGVGGQDGGVDGDFN